MVPLIADMVVVMAMRGRSGVVREARVNIIVIMIILAEDTTSMITSNAITMIYIGIIPITIDRTNMKSADLIIVVPGALNIVLEEMFIKEEPVTTRVVLEVPVTVITKQIEI